MCIGTELAVPVLTIAQLLGNIARVSTGFKEIEWKTVGYFSITAHVLKTVIYSKLTQIDLKALCIGVAMGLAMLVGTYVAKHFIVNMEKGKFKNMWYFCFVWLVRICCRKLEMIYKWI